MWGVGGWVVLRWEGEGLWQISRVETEEEGEVGE